MQQIFHTFKKEKDIRDSLKVKKTTRGSLQVSSRCHHYSYRSDKQSLTGGRRRGRRCDDVEPLLVANNGGRRHSRHRQLRARDEIEAQRTGTVRAWSVAKITGEGGEEFSRRRRFRLVSDQPENGSINIPFALLLRANALFALLIASLYSRTTNFRDKLSGEYLHRARG